MRGRQATLLVSLVATVGLVAGPGAADHFDNDPTTGSFDPQLSVMISTNVVNRASDLTIRLTQKDHEDPPVLSTFRLPGQWQFPFGSLRQAASSGGTPTTNCEDAIDGLRDSPDGGSPPSYAERSNARFARAERIGTGNLDLHADGISRPGSPVRYQIDIGFIAWDAATETAQLCLLLVTKDARVTTLTDPPGPAGCSPGATRCDDIEGVTELVAQFPLPRKTLSDGRLVWEAVSDLSGTVKDAVLQQLNLSLIDFRTAYFARTPGNWHPGGITFSVTPAVEGTYVFEGIFTTCPENDPSYTTNGPADPGPDVGCRSNKGPVQRVLPIQIVPPPPAVAATVTVTANPSSLSPTGRVVLSATLADASGSGIAGQPLHFLVTDRLGRVVLNKQRTTNADGVATDAVSGLQTLAPGRYQVTVYAHDFGASGGAIFSVLVDV